MFIAKQTFVVRCQVLTPKKRIHHVGVLSTESLLNVITWNHAAALRKRGRCICCWRQRRINIKDRCNNWRKYDNDKQRLIKCFVFTHDALVCSPLVNSGESKFDLLMFMWSYTIQRPVSNLLQSFLCVIMNSSFPLDGNRNFL